MARPDQQPESQPDEAPNPQQTQIQLSSVSQTEDSVSQIEDHSQVQIANHSKSSTAKSTPVITTVQLSVIGSLTIRAATWICLLASLIALAANTSSVNGVYKEVKIGFSNIYAYRYSMSTIVIGFVYTSVHVSVEFYQVITGKSLLTGNGIPKIIFYSDKLLLSLLATGVGAAFGATYDLKKNFDDLDDLLVFFDDPILSEARPKLDNFFSVAYVSAGFLLVAFLCSIVSSILSSLALYKNTK
uniref:CASP-like protein 4D1 n=1 Tax=Erigeron canadensis TaxID=72917 RepID=UPI001CB912EE|nr:CASP-like protein 4D1 [Erigeron canadensis]